MTNFLYYFLNIFNMLFSLFMIWVMIKLLFIKEYRECPPYVPSFGQEKKFITQRVGEILSNTTETKTILDPGCGTGTLLISLAKKFPQHNFIGIEWGYIPYLITKLKGRKLKNLTVIHNDMFKCSFKEADIIVCFLMQPLMERFGKKVKEDAKKDLIVFSNSFEIPNIKLSEKIETNRFLFVKNIYVYKDVFQTL